MPGAHEQFGFFIDSGATPDGGVRIGGSRATPLRTAVRRATPPWLAFPDGSPVFLIVAAGGTPNLASEVSDGAETLAGLARLEYERHTYVMMLVPGDRTIHLNGVTAPPVTLLRIGDQLEWNGATVLHLSAFRRPYLGPARPDDLGQECPVCRVRFTEQSVVLVCVHCGAVMHCESQAPGSDAPLECARLSTECPRCGHELVTEEGFAYVPED